MEERKCSECGNTHPLTERYWHRSGEGRFHTQCKTCRRKLIKEKTAAQSYLMQSVRLKQNNAERLAQLVREYGGSAIVVSDKTKFRVLALFLMEKADPKTLPFAEAFSAYWPYSGLEIPND